MRLLRMLPYCLPMLLTLLLVGLAYVDGSWVFAVMLFLAAIVNQYWGRFSHSELSGEYQYFHHSDTMTIFKGLNGAFFVLFNLWVAFFCLYHEFTTLSFIIFVYSVIVVNSGFGLSLAHELTHEAQSLHRWLGDALMLQNGFFYLSYDHVFIHHQHVGTLDDPASALLNENLYAYLKRSLVGRMQMIFTNTTANPTKRQKRLQRAIHWKLAICLGWLVAAFIISKFLFIIVLAQYIFVILIYETITYIQHYGLRRQQRDKVNLDHSWNSFDRMYNYLYFFMPVHSLHHANMSPETSGEYTGPTMPLSFPRMLILAFRPNKWFKTMNPLVRQIQDRQDLAKVWV